LSDDYRSKAEIFVTTFLDYITQHDILDEFDKRTQKMVRSEGVENLVKMASEIFPPRVRVGKVETDKLSQEELDKAVAESSEVVVDRRDVFSRKIQANGAARGLLARVLAGDSEAIELGRELVAADAGEKTFT
jgi:hypothetical protein